MRKSPVKFFEIREDERTTALLMFSYIFLIVASLMILKPVRNSLFLVEFGVEKLPFVFVLVAFFATSGSYLISRLDRNKRLNFQILSTLLLSIIILLIFWLLLSIDLQHNWLLFALYVWVSMFGVVTSTQFWLLANDIFNAREAKRLFGFLGAGAISGGIFGGYMTKYMASRLNTENLIIFPVVFIAVCILLVLLVWSRTTRQRRAKRHFARTIRGVAPKPASPARIIPGSRHLLFLTGLVWVSVCVGNLADYQFSAIASRSITDADKLTAFFGFWMSNLNVLSLLIQFFITSRVIRYSGIGVSLFFLPISLLVGTLTVMVNPALWSAVFIKTSDGAFKHSINRAATELLYLPIPAEIKNRTKTFIDVVTKNLATGVAGIFLILLTTVLHFSVPHVGFVNIALIAVWIYLIVNVEREYVNSFRSAVLKRTINLDQETLNVEDASVFESLVKVLEGDNEHQIAYVLGLLEDVQNKELIPHLIRLSSHPSDEIKTIAMRMALRYDDIDLSENAKELVSASNQAVKVEAIRYLCGRSEDMVGTLNAFLDHGDSSVRNAALLCAAREWSANKDFREAIDLKKIIEEKYKALQSQSAADDQMRSFLISTARAIGQTRDERLYPFLATMFNTAKYPEVVQAAVTSAGETGDLEFVPSLIRHLKTKAIRRYAIESLAGYGEEAVDTLSESFENPAEDIRIRLAIPRVLSSILSQKSVDVLEKKLAEDSLTLRYAVLKALNKLRTRQPGLRFDKTVVVRRILDEVDYYKMHAILLLRQRDLEERRTNEQHGNAASQLETKARRLLITALEERLDYALARIFRLLGLRYDPKDMYGTYLGIVSMRSDLSANAVEFLDNVLDRDLKRIVLPIVEKGPQAITATDSRDFFGDIVLEDDKSADVLLEINDTWLRVCALYLIAVIRRPGLEDRIAPLQADPDPMVKETARFYLRRMAAAV